MAKNFVSVNSLSSVEKDKLRDAIKELNDTMLRVSAEKQLQKEIVEKVSEELGVEKKIIRRMAKVYFKSNFNSEVEEHNAFEELYTNVLLGSIPGA